MARERDREAARRLSPCYRNHPLTHYGCGGCPDCTRADAIARALAAREAEVREARKPHIDALVGWLHELVAQGRVPRTCGACGTPNASCDMDCAVSAYMSNDIAAAIRAGGGA
jgi:hypothetical protein